MRQKLGLLNKESGDELLIQDLLKVILHVTGYLRSLYLCIQVMFKYKADYTMTFRELSEINLEDLQLANYPKVKIHGICCLDVMCLALDILGSS